MSMRISSAILLLALAAGCHRNDDAAAGPAGGNAGAPLSAADDAAPSASAETIACARGDAALADDCTLDREMGKDGQILTVRRPDGSFRRLLVTSDGRGVVAADGSQRAVVSVIGGDGIEVRIGADRYRLPATVKGSTAGG